MATPTSGMAIASLILGILWIGGLGSILAVIFGHIARKEIREGRASAQGGGLALAGIIMGWVGIVALIAYIIFIIALNHAVNSFNN